MADSLNYRGKPPWSQGRTSDSDKDRLVKTGVVDLQSPYRPDPMDAVTAGYGDGEFTSASSSAIKAANAANGSPSIAGDIFPNQLGDSIDMQAANSSKPYDEDVRPGNPVSGPVFPGGK